MRWLKNILARLRPARLGDAFLADLRAGMSGGHPYAAAIEAARRTSPAATFLNCRARNCTVGGPLIPDGEFGPQCDELEPGDEVLAQDREWAYLADGRRLKLRAPRHG